MRWLLGVAAALVLAAPAQAATYCVATSAPGCDGRASVADALGAAASEPGGIRHGPRPIDVDVLLLGDLRHDSERLRLPHREVLTRRFVLVPLLELDPDLEVPGGGRAADALAALGPGQDVRLAGPPLDVGS